MPLKSEFATDVGPKTAGQGKTLNPIQILISCFKLYSGECLCLWL